MKPQVLSSIVGDLYDHLPELREILMNASLHRPLLTERKAVAVRIIRRGVEILKALRLQDPKAYDDLQFLSSESAHWAFLYAQSGTPVKECVKLFIELARKTTKGKTHPGAKASAVRTGDMYCSACDQLWEPTPRWAPERCPDCGHRLVVPVSVQ